LDDKLKAGVKVVILAGGFGSRLAEETMLRPKPMVEIGGKPILWHIMNIYAACGMNEFIIALGYKSEVIKEYFLNFFAINNDISIDLSTGKTTIHNGKQLNWKIHLIDTGLYAQTGGRLKRLRPWLDGSDTFMLTYGDGVANINTADLLAFHRSHGKLATITTVHPPARFGSVVLSGDQVIEFQEKTQSPEGRINGGFFVLDRRVLDYIHDDNTSWENGPLEQLAREGQLMGYQHDGFWQAMDTLREKQLLESLWQSGKAPWQVWG